MRIVITYRKSEMGQSYGLVIEGESVDDALREFKEQHPDSWIDCVVILNIER